VTTDDGLGPDETALDGVGLPAVPVSAGALIFDRARRLLILKPTYKTGWTIPGGVMESDGERPCRTGKPGGVRYLFDCGCSATSAWPGSWCSLRRSPSTGWPTCARH